MDVVHEEIDISSLSTGEIDIRRWLPEREHTLSASADGIGSMRTDRTKVKQCLLNVLRNGSKFTQNGKLTSQSNVCKAISDVQITMRDTDGMSEDIGRLSRPSTRPMLDHKKFGGNRPRSAPSRATSAAARRDVSVASKVGGFDLHDGFSRSGSRRRVDGAGRNGSGATRAGSVDVAATSRAVVDDDARRATF